jgi:hypothetical protein
MKEQNACETTSVLGVGLDMVQEWEKLDRTAQVDKANVHHDATTIGNQSTHFFTGLATYGRKNFCCSS